MRLVGKILVPRSLARVDRNPGGGVHALSLGGIGHWPANFVGGQKPIRGQPTHAIDHVFAGRVAFRVSLRPPQHAHPGTPSHLPPPAPVLREFAANHFSPPNTFVPPTPPSTHPPPPTPPP